MKPIRSICNERRKKSPTNDTHDAADDYKDSTCLRPKDKLLCFLKMPLTIGVIISQS